MLDEKLGEEAPIEPARLLKRVDCRVFRLKSQIEGGVSKREVEIDQEGALGGILGQCNREIARDRGNAGATFRAYKREQPAPRFFRWSNCGLACGGSNQRFGHGALSERNRQDFANPRSHALDDQFPIFPL